MNAVDAIKNAMIKAAAQGRIEDNEDQTNKGVNNVRENPPERGANTLDAPWGEHPQDGQNGYPDVYSTAVMREGKDTRAGVLERIFDSPKTSGPQAQKQMNELFENMGKAESHSPLLQRGKLPIKEASDESLTDAVIRVAGRR